jgi:hypothetical protein
MLYSTITRSVTCNGVGWCGVAGASYLIECHLQTLAYRDDVIVLYLKCPKCPKIILLDYLDPLLQNAYYVKK